MLFLLLSTVKFEINVGVNNEITLALTQIVRTKQEGRETKVRGCEACFQVKLNKKLSISYTK
jgi:hypothetical protein